MCLVCASNREAARCCLGTAVLALWSSSVRRRTNVDQRKPASGGSGQAQVQAARSPSGAHGLQVFFQNEKCGEDAGHGAQPGVVAALGLTRGQDPNGFAFGVAAGEAGAGETGGGSRAARGSLGGRTEKHTVGVHQLSVERILEDGGAQDSSSAMIHLGPCTWGHQP